LPLFLLFSSLPLPLPLLFPFPSHSRSPSLLFSQTAEFLCKRFNYESADLVVMSTAQRLVTETPQPKSVTLPVLLHQLLIKRKEREREERERGRAEERRERDIRGVFFLGLIFSLLFTRNRSTDREPTFPSFRRRNFAATKQLFLCSVSVRPSLPTSSLYLSSVSRSPSQNSHCERYCKGTVYSLSRGHRAVAS
jgi:hypothetical protein